MKIVVEHDTTHCTLADTVRIDSLCVVKDCDDAEALLTEPMYSVFTLASGALMRRVAGVRVDGTTPVPTRVSKYMVVAFTVGRVRLWPPAVNVPPV